MNSPYKFSSKISQVIERYLSIKQALGRQYKYAFLIFKHLDKFLVVTQSDLTSESFTAWIFTKQNLSDTGKREWMRIARNLCLYRQRTNPACFVPNLLQFPKRGQAIQPHIFTESKFHKSRLLPLSPDAWFEIDAALKKRRGLRLPNLSETPLFWHPSGKTGAYSKTGSWHVFHSLFESANIRTINNVIPRVHDIRHTFAVHVLLRWYREGIDVQSRLPMLSIYMGHTSIVSTQYYLGFLEKIAQIANDRFEKRYGSIVTETSKRGEL